MKKTVVAAITTLLCTTSITAVAGETQIGRYTSVSNTASFAQQNLLATEIKVNFPEQVTTLQQAFEQLLATSGYRLSQENLDVDIDVLYEQPLPDVHRWIGPMTLREALQTLAGNTWELVTNPVDRTVTFKLDESYRYLVSKRRPVVTGSELKIKTDDPTWSCGDRIRIDSVEPIYFGPNSFSLNYKDEAKLNKLVDKAKSMNLGVVIKSYADPSGPEAMHMALSQARGSAVGEYLEKSGANVLAIKPLGATYPNPDAPVSRQRVAEVLLVQSLCEEQVEIPVWTIVANDTLKETLFKWIAQSQKWRNLVYKVKNEHGKDVKVTFPQSSKISGEFTDVLAKLIHELRKRPGVVRLKSELYQGDNTVVIEGLIKEASE